MKALKIAVVGYGSFSPEFIPLFQMHPNVGEVSVADTNSDRCDRARSDFGIQRTFSSLDEALRSDIDAVAIFTQRHLHGSQAIQALEAGKHVFSAVPATVSLPELYKLIETVKATRLTYMLGETSYYYPSTIYCRRKFRDGEFGRFVYGDGCYFHDMSHGFYEAFKNTGGLNWRRVAGVPPMYYPTHSTSMILSVVGGRMTSVSCLGVRDDSDDGVFGEGKNQWDNPFSNQIALFRTSCGGVARVAEMRRVGWIGRRPSVYMSLYGTLGTFEEQGNAVGWGTLTAPMEQDPELLTLLTCDKPYMTGEEWLQKQAKQRMGVQEDFVSGKAPIHPKHKLPAVYDGLIDGHEGSHQFLAHDFLVAVVTGKLPPNHAWAAAKYNAPGLVAHESSLRGGESLPIPDFGDPPDDWELIEPCC